ncbi:UNVERIFIED_CONTAM: dihydrofolate reductase family protein [Kocuria sp. CPCC 205295]|uniref:dihydrofolate reductase family protein n=1 Tax=Kocuria TaxID=57493 RepID=UPI0034D3B6BE
MDTHAPAPGPGRGWSGTVFCRVSLDGFIARTDGDIGWLEAPVPAGQAAPSGSGTEAVPDFEALVARVDHLVMGRATFQKVLEIGFWPYDPLQVIVLSSTLTGPQPPGALVAPDLSAAVALLESRGARGVYWDGGATIQAALRADLVDELVVTTVPRLIGGGIALFGALEHDLPLRLRGSRVLDGGMVSTRYDVVREVSSG